MNIIGRNLLSLTVYHLRRAVRLVIGAPVIDSITVGPDGTVVVDGSGGTPGQTIVITFPDGTVGTGVVGGDGDWSVTSPGVVTPVPSAPDLIVDQVPTPTAPVVPEPGEVKPGEGGGTVVGGGGANPGDDVEVTLPGGETGSGEADGDGEWEVEFPDVPYDPDLDPGDVGVGTSPQPGSPVVEDIATLPDGSVIVSGSGAKPGDIVTVTLPDGTTSSGVADDNGNWSIFIPEAQGSVTGPGDVTVGAQPDPMAGSVSAPDAVYVDIAGMEFVEVDDNGNYLSWEQFIEQIRRVIGINTTATSSISFASTYGYPKRVLKSGNTYIAAFDSQYVIFESENQINQGTARVVAKNYITDRSCDTYKTEHAAYYFRRDGGLDRLTRLDGSDTPIALDIAGTYGDQKLPAMTSLGEEDWLVNSDFSISYLINPASLSVRPGPVFSDLTLHIEGLGAEISSANGRVFASASSVGAQGLAIYEINQDGYSLVSQDGGSIVAGNAYLYAVSGANLRTINLSTGVERATTLGSEVHIGYARGDFAVFLNDDVSLTVTYDAGETFEKVFQVEGDSSLKWLDVENDNLILTRNFREFDLLEYKLVEE